MMTCEKEDVREEVAQNSARRHGMEQLLPNVPNVIGGTKTKNKT